MTGMAVIIIWPTKCRGKFMPLRLWRTERSRQVRPHHNGATVTPTGRVCCATARRLDDGACPARTRVSWSVQPIFIFCSSRHFRVRAVVSESTVRFERQVAIIYTEPATRAHPWMSTRKSCWNTGHLSWTRWNLRMMRPSCNARCVMLSATAAGCVETLRAFARSSA
jgi:hypothetical protein